MSTHSQAWPNDGVGIAEWCTLDICPRCGHEVWRTKEPMKPTLRGKNGGIHKCSGVMTGNMVHVLQMIGNGLPPFRGATGRSEHGGREATLHALKHRGFLLPDWSITEKGREMLSRIAGKARA